MAAGDFQKMADELNQLLGLQVPPLAITFSQMPPARVPFYNAPISSTATTNLAQQDAASCVFWIKGLDHTFTTVAADHQDCNIGSLVHGFKSLEEAADGSDVALLVQSGWVSPDLIPRIPTVKTRYQYVTYGPLAETPITPDIIFLRINAKQTMMLSDAWPGLRIDGKPQCHIVAIAMEEHEPSVSVGCILSRIRTGMSDNDMTCTIPADKLPLLLSRLKDAQAAYDQVCNGASCLHRQSEGG